MKTETETEIERIDFRERTENGWYQKLEDMDLLPQDVPPYMDAGNLLHIMRPAVESILQAHVRFSPPSQTYRVLRLLPELEELQRSIELSDLHSDPYRTIRRQINTLKDFLAVHRTVWILEGKPL